MWAETNDLHKFFNDFLSLFKKIPGLYFKLG